MKNKTTHGGKRKGAGRKPAPLPAFTKKLRATQRERFEFTELLTGDARQDFLNILNALKFWKREDDRLIYKGLKYKKIE